MSQQLRTLPLARHCLGLTLGIRSLSAAEAGHLCGEDAQETFEGAAGLAGPTKHDFGV